MTYIQLFICILVIHFLADFALQTHEQATKKGESNKWLFYHVGTYTLVWLCTFLFLPIQEDFNNIYGFFIFGILIFVPHFITDWITSRVGKPFWSNNDYHNGFVVIGFDQVIHYLCLLWLLSNILILK